MGYRGRRKSLKRLTAPKSWMLDKTGGVFAPKSSPGPHKARESFPMTLFLRNRLRYALSYQEYKLCRVRKTSTGPKNVPFIVTHDGRTIRYPDPLVKVNDTVMVDIASGKMKDYIKFDTGNLVMITGGHNLGRVGTITHRERHPGSFDIVHVKDAMGHTFATRLSYVFVIGKGNKAWISLPRGKGVKLTIAEERDRRIAARAQ
ncbi:40S ribosomal protein S4 [Elysia marginata]|uniref:40S ribosomal protein S4 n=1 Tax=Elysia marginata TaxID=1093978 RepID=A0AAV4G4C9_9GAST|nr:40S ribosomal protein S4 [Elysia marginata]